MKIYNTELVIMGNFFKCRVTAVDGQYQIGIYTVREIQYGEEITFDYNSVTEVCLLPVRLHTTILQCSWIL